MRVRPATTTLSANSQACDSRLNELLGLQDIDTFRRWFLHLTLANEHFMANNMRLAISEVVHARRNAVATLMALQTSSVVSGLSALCCAHLDSFAGFLFLHVGSIGSAETSFECAQKWFCLAHNYLKEHSSSMFNFSMTSKSAISTTSSTWPFSLPYNPFIQAALVAFAGGRCCLASRLFDWASREVYRNVTFASPAQDISALIPESADRCSIVGGHPLSSKCTNNLAVCALNMCDLEAAVWLLEQLVRSNPPLHLDQPVAFNLCTMYDLSTDNTKALSRKRLLQQAVTRYQLPGLAASTFHV